MAALLHDTNARRVAPTTDDLRHTIPTKSPSSRRAFAVHLGPLGYAVAWGGIYVFHAVCALYCFEAAMLFRENPDSVVIAYFTFFHTITEPRFFPAISIVHIIVGSIHACFVVEPVLRSIYRLVTIFLHRTASRTNRVLVNRVASLPQSLAQRIPRTLKSVAYFA